MLTKTVSTPDSLQGKTVDCESATDNPSDKIEVDWSFARVHYAVLCKNSFLLRAGYGCPTRMSLNEGESDMAGP